MVPGPADSVTGSPFRTIWNSNSPTRTRKVSAAGRVCIFAGPLLAGISASKGAKTNSVLLHRHAKRRKGRGPNLHLNPL